MRVCVVHNDLWPWTIYWRSFNHEFTIKLQKYVTYCCVFYIQLWMVFFPYLAQMITSVRRCVLWPWLISSRSFRQDFAIKLLKYDVSCIHIWHKYNPWGDNVLHTISRSIGQRLRTHWSFELICKSSHAISLLSYILGSCYFSCFAFFMIHPRPWLKKKCLTCVGNAIVEIRWS